jgi:hypothetical protein
MTTHHPPFTTHPIGLRPWLPWPLNRSAWWTEPVPAERLAALRIGLAAVLLLDLFTTYLPHAGDFFGANSLGSRDVVAWMGQAPSWRWSLLRSVDDARLLTAAIGVWIVATFCLLVGFWSRLSAVLVWVLAVSFTNLNPYIVNAGDDVRDIVLLYLLLSPCGAVWSLDRWWQTRRAQDPKRVQVQPWPLRLLFIQMALIYFCNGVYKVCGSEWRTGESLYYVLSDLTLARWSYTQVPIPLWVTRLLSWAVMVWEVSFPLLVMLPWIGGTVCRLCRAPETVRLACDRVLRLVTVVALWFGVGFHLGIGLTMELGFFAAYMLCLYLPLVPWERYRLPGRALTHRSTVDSVC